MKQRIGSMIMTGIFAVTMLSAGSAAGAEIYHVTPTGAGSADGSDWANAFGNLQDAVDASIDGDTIRMNERL